MRNQARTSLECGIVWEVGSEGKQEPENGETPFSGLQALLSQFSPESDVKGRQFERLCQWFFRNAPEYQGLFSDVWLWDEWPDKWGRDAGIDLVMREAGSGDLWAVQAKAYESEYYIKKADVDSFLAETGRGDFSYRLLVATTDGLGTTARETIDKQKAKVGRLLRSQLEAAEVEWPASFNNLRPARPKPLKSKPHQKSATRDVMTGLRDGGRGQLIMACGTGKTLVGLKVSEQLEAQRTLVLFPSLSLLSQTLRSWAANSTLPFSFLAVCSDDTVSDEDSFVTSVAELGLPTTTDPDKIKSFLSKRSGRRVVFSTYQSSPRIAEAMSTGCPGFDISIEDEAHRCAGVVTSDFATILDDKLIRSKRRLFMTATPRYYTSRVVKEADGVGVEVASMDDEKTFGPVLHNLPFHVAIQKGLLSDYQVLVVAVDDKTYEGYATNGRFINVNGESCDARTVASQIALAKAMKEHDLGHVLSFHGRVKAARKFSEEMPRVIEWLPKNDRPSGELWSSYVSGEMNSGKRDMLLNKFRNLDEDQRGLLSSARCLAEGVDVPSIDGVAFIDPRGSTIDIIQAVGRAIRKSKDKKIGTIVIPVFLSNDADAESELSTSAFQHVWGVVRALRAHDDVLAEELDGLREGMGRHSAPAKCPNKVKLDVPTSVSEDFLSAFSTMLVETTSASWDFHYGLLQKFVIDKGRFPVHGEQYLGRKIASWCFSQRQLYKSKNKQLTKERISKLESLSGWVWSTQEAAWQKGFKHLENYVKQYGDARMPIDSKYEGYNLGAWINAQRSKRSKLPQEYKKKLESLPGWVWNMREADWEEGFRQLEAYIEENGNAFVPAKHMQGDFKLGQWVNIQRTLKKQISIKHRRRLEGLSSWVWDARMAAWEKGFQQLTIYIEEHGTPRVDKEYVQNNFNLGKWVHNQRVNRGRLPKERWRRLENLPGWIWDPHEAAWQKGFQKLEDYVKQNGNALVPSPHMQDDFKLGKWVFVQRKSRGQMPQYRKEKLESLSGWAWHGGTAKWEESFAQLKAYVKQYGNVSIAKQHFKNNSRLTHWTAHQREIKDKLPEERQRKLESLPGWIWSGRATWDDWFSQLETYVKEHGNALVPYKHIQNDLKLGSWVSEQRKQKDKMSLSRKQKLESLHGWAWAKSRASSFPK